MLARFMFILISNQFLPYVDEELLSYALLMSWDEI